MKKIIKKKLDEMTVNEVKQIEKRYCTTDSLCRVCPLHIKGEVSCLVQFHYWKQQYETYKDKEFEIEVEE